MSDSSSIANFPDFSPFSFQQLNTYSSHIAHLQYAYGDFDFSNLAVWMNMPGDLSISLIHGNLLLRYSDVLQDDKPLLYTLAGSQQIKDTLEDLRTFFKSENTKPILTAVPAEVEAELPAEVERHENRDSAEYMLDTSEQVALSGGNFGKYRRKINHFKENVGDNIEVKEVDLKSDDELVQLINTSHTWDSMYSFRGNDPRRVESLAVGRALQNSATLGYHCVAVYISGALEGFTLFTVDKDRSTAILQHTKTAYKYPNIFDFLVHATASVLVKDGIKYINFEQDLGIPGLREHKLGLRPSFMLKKYDVYL